MKKYILLSLSAFILACLIGGGIVWRLETKGKIKFKWNSEANNQALTLDRLIRELIPDSGQIYGKWDVLAQQEDPVDWEYENSQGAQIWPRIGTVKLVGNDNKPIPGYWDILLKEKDTWYPEGYKLFGISHDSIFDIAPQVFPIKLQEGEQAELLPLKKGKRLPFVNKKALYELYSVQLKGKAPAQLLIEWPGENNGHTFNIYGETSAIEKLWDPSDDVFEFKDLKNQNKQIQAPSCSSFDKDDLEYTTRGGFTIEKNGSITNIECEAKYLYGNRTYSEEETQEIEQEMEQAKRDALRILKSMPKWKPGKIKGKSVRVRYNFD
ncbi:hypothetical protein [Odoribacter lunatus]|uniref:hypothetical protein n=1 Tax=Odoribacter lunatus TaxID=2941335 RepID=UPI00203F9564|nr:hypothetical protein [Odoribacter lunatus]